MSEVSGRNLGVVRVFVFVLLGMLAAGMIPVQAEEVFEKPLPEACGLLDDPEKRALMDGLLFKLLVACGRTDELGLVRQAPAEEVGPGTDDGPDVGVNDPSGDSGSSTTQSETSMAVNEDTGTVCAGYNDSVHYFVSGEGFTGFSRSTDNGATFVDQGALGVDSIGDPAIVWRRADGHFYFGALHTNGLGLWKSTDDCQNFQWVGMMHSGGSDDKELIAVDNNQASPHYGNLYMVFTNFSSDSRIWALRSTDAGVTWTNAQAISLTSNVQGAWPAVAPNGDIFVGWVKFDGNSVTMEYVRSTDGGVSYSAITSPAANKARPQNTAATNSCFRAALNGNIRYLPSPQVVVGSDGVLHTVYSYSPGGGDDCDSYYRQSTDSGATWGPEIRLHDDATTSDQFFPTLSVGAGNIVSATWYDRRLDPNESPGRLLSGVLVRRRCDLGAESASLGCLDTDLSRSRPRHLLSRRLRHPCPDDEPRRDPVGRRPESDERSQRSGCLFRRRSHQHRFSLDRRSDRRQRVQPEHRSFHGQPAPVPELHRVGHP